jgi:hypothetical protein
MTNSLIKIIEYGIFFLSATTVVFGGYSILIL